MSILDDVRVGINDAQHGGGSRQWIRAVLSIVIAVTLVLAVIFICTLMISAGIFPRRIVSSWLGVVKVTTGDYLKVSFLIACIASVVGWLGAGFTQSDDFRLMLYTGSRNRGV